MTGGPVGTQLPGQIPSQPAQARITIVPTSERATTRLQTARPEIAQRRLPDLLEMSRLAGLRIPEQLVQTAINRVS